MDNTEKNSFNHFVKSKSESEKVRKSDENTVRMVGFLFFLKIYVQFSEKMTVF